MKRKFCKVMLIGGGILVASLVVSEIVLRSVWGFCDSPLCVASEQYEYICAPNQDRHRFGHHIVYNSYSQRSEEPDSSKIIVLGLGDSVINGGVLTDNEALATSLVCSDSIQVLNISAGSWGPDNCAAYLREHGLFGAKAFLLVVSSHDAYDNMNFQPTVGVHVSFPDKQYVSAIYELVDRYLVPRVKSKLGKKSLDPDQQVVAGVGIDKKGGLFNPGFAQLKAMADSTHIPMAIYLHPDMEEYKQHRYNSQGEDIIAWAKENQVPLYLGMDVEKLENYRDGIHINADGQKELARTFRKMLADMHLMN